MNITSEILKKNGFEYVSYADSYIHYFNANDNTGLSSAIASISLKKENNKWTVKIYDWLWKQLITVHINTVEEFNNTMELGYIDFKLK